MRWIRIGYARRIDFWGGAYRYRRFIVDVLSISLRPSDRLDIVDISAKCRRHLAVCNICLCTSMVSRGSRGPWLKGSIARCSLHQGSGLRRGVQCHVGSTDKISHPQPRFVCMKSAANFSTVWGHYVKNGPTAERLSQATPRRVETSGWSYL